MEASILIKQSPLNLKDTLTVLEHICGVDKNYIFLHQDKIEVDFEAFNNIVSKIISGMPIQYALGKWWFFGHEFFLEAPVLIPRVETELLVEQAISIVKDNMIGFEPFVGSGAVSISLLKYFLNLKMIVSDISLKACKLTLKNAIYHGVEDRIFIINTDLANGINANIDFIVANPPYIPTERLKTLDKSVIDYEDTIALDGKEDGLFFYKKLKTLNIKPMILEIGHDQEEAMKEIFEDVDIVYDYSNNPRVAIVR